MVSCLYNQTFYTMKKLIVASLVLLAGMAQAQDHPSKEPKKKEAAATKKEEVAPASSAPAPAPDPAPTPASRSINEKGLSTKPVPSGQKPNNIQNTDKMPAAEDKKTGKPKE